MTTHTDETQKFERQEELGFSKGLLLLRDQLLPNLLGEEHSFILYWAGKELARQLPLDDEEAVIRFFHTHGFGTLTRSSSNKKSITYILTGHIVTSRLEKKEPSFSLEAGFLAEQYQSQQDRYAEATVEIDSRKQQVRLIVQTDKKSPVL